MWKKKKKFVRALINRKIENVKKQQNLNTLNQLKAIPTKLVDVDRFLFSFLFVVFFSSLKKKKKSNAQTINDERKS